MSAFVEVSPDQAAAVISEQFPPWAGLALRRVEPGGSDHVIYRLGDELAARFPRHDGAAGQARHEAHWLPRVAEHLPLAVPRPVALGEPADGYPWNWAVHRWLDGEAVSVEEYEDSGDAADTLAGFISALQALPVGCAPDPTPLPLHQRDSLTRHAIAAVAGEFDAAALTRVWTDGLSAPAWHGEPVWYHGDFHTGNLLAEDHKITAVIDFGGLAVGDPANDLMMAFTLFDDRTRGVFRNALVAHQSARSHNGTTLDDAPLDDATWQRARAWALTTGLTAYTAYAATDPRIKKATTRQILAAVKG